MLKKIPQKVFKGTVTKNEIVAEGVNKISITLDQPFDFLPSQYVWVEIPSMKIPDPRGSRRAFSIFNTVQSDNTIEVVARISDSGYKQSLFALSDGDPVNIHGPFGSSFVVSEAHQPHHIMMIAGGVGIAAFMPTIKAIKAKGYKIKCFLLYLNEDKKSTPFLKELERLKSETKLFDFKALYTKFSWLDIKDVAERITGGVEWWIAGSQLMVDHVYQELEQVGVSRRDMVFENFYPTLKNSLTREKIAAQMNENNLFAMAIQNSTNHTIITDPEGTILFANQAAERITGYTQEEIVGNTPRLWGGMMSSEFYRDFWHKKLSGESFQGEIINRRKNGEIYYSIAHIAPIFGTGREIIGYIGTEEDITTSKEQEQQIADKEERLQMALEGNRDGLWDWNIVTGEAYFSSRWKSMLGYKEEEIPGTIKEWEQRLHPEDSVEVMRILTAHLEGKTEYYESKHRLLCKDGSYLWILDRGKVIDRDAEGKALRAIGTHTDITKEKERELELERLNRAMVNRELKMIELKQHIKELEQKQNVSDED